VEHQKIKVPCNHVVLRHPRGSSRCPAQARVQTASQVLCGYFVIPDTMDRALEVTINPIGNRTRSERRVWNAGHQRLKLVRV
jgi:hypothetical protein